VQNAYNAINGNQKVIRGAQLSAHVTSIDLLDSRGHKGTVLQDLFDKSPVLFTER